MIFTGYARKVAKVEPTPTPVVEKVQEQTVQVEKPVLSEEEVFLQKTLDDLNKEGNLKRIHFDFDKYTIRDDMKAVFQADADWLLGHSTVELIVEGHCDERGTIEYNIALGEKRAEAGRNYLVNLGVAPAKINL